MIDLRKETMLTLPQAIRWLAERGIKRDRGSIYRWAELGKLETVRFGGRLYTSIEALERMAQPQRAKEKRQRPRRVIEDEAQLRAKLRSMGMKV